MYVITIWHSIVKENITYSKDTSYKDDTTYYLLAYFLSNGLYFVHNDLIVLFFCKKRKLKRDTRKDSSCLRFHY